MGKGMTKCVPYSHTLELLGVSRRPFGNRNARKKAHTKPIEEFHLHCVAGKAQQISNFQENFKLPGKLNVSLFRDLHQASRGL